MSLKVLPVSLKVSACVSHKLAHSFPLATNIGQCFVTRDAAYGKKSLKDLARHWSESGLLDWSNIDFTLLIEMHTSLHIKNFLNAWCN